MIVMPIGWLPPFRQSPLSRAYGAGPSLPRKQGRVIARPKRGSLPRVRGRVGVGARLGSLRARPAGGRSSCDEPSAVLASTGGYQHTKNQSSDSLLVGEGLSASKLDYHNPTRDDGYETDRSSATDMPKKAAGLTARQVATIKTPGFHAAGGAWPLPTGDGGAGRSWVYRYQLAGKRRDMGIGPLDAFGLAEARERAAAARQDRPGWQRPDRGAPSRAHGRSLMPPRE